MRLVRAGLGRRGLSSAAIGTELISGAPMTSGDEFPMHGLLPRVETQAEKFMLEHPTYDGRGVTVAILDTGVDPNAAGLKGKVKYVADAAGCGDVDMTKKVSVVDGKVTIRGHIIEIPDGVDEVRTGEMMSWKLFPSSLIKRVQKERKREMERVWAARLEGMESGDLQDEYRAMIGKWEDPGEVVDWVMWNQEGNWVIKIAGESRTIAQGEVLEGGEKDRFVSSVEVFEDGDVLSVVGNCGAHGTHVAGIVGARGGDVEGVAPGCEIVGLKIGDSRLGSMETGTGIIRAVNIAHRLGCQVLNMSYGEAAALPGSGRIMKCIEDVVRRGSVFCASAGNAGPALSSVGAPGGGGGEKGAMSIGALVSEPMMKAEYGMLMDESLREDMMQFTWSSRGPGFNGEAGVCISAPGAAITSVPSWTLQKTQLMNGTSMSSPNAAGCMALLISGLIQEGVAYTPYRIRKAIEATAVPVPGVEPWALGRGLIQVSDAFDYLMKFRDHADQDVVFEVNVPSTGGQGVYLREWEETRGVKSLAVEVNPLFDEDASHDPKLDFECRLTLKCNADWVSCPTHLALMHGGRTFSLAVDAGALEPGCHFTEILGYDSSCPEKAPLVRIPVTVVKPESIQGHKVVYENLSFQPGTISRKFVTVPSGASVVSIKVRSKSGFDDKKQFILHCLYHKKQKSHSNTSFRSFFVLEKNHEQSFGFNVEAGRTLEIATAQFWKTLGDNVVDLEVDFHGPLVSTPSVQLSYANSVARFDLSSPLQRESLDISTNLTHLEQSLAPVSSKISVLKGNRNRMMDGKSAYELVLNYDFKLSEAGKVTVSAPLLNDFLYSSRYEAQFWMIIDSNGQVVGRGDAWPKPVALPKGDFKIGIQVRHDSVPSLEKLKQMPVVLKRELGKKIPLSVHKTFQDAIDNTATIPKSTKMSCGASLPCFMRVADRSAMEKGIPKKDFKNDASVSFSGEIVLMQVNGVHSAKVKIPVTVDNYPVTVPKIEADKSEDKKKGETADEFNAEEGYRDSVVKWLSSINSEDEFALAFEQHASKFPRHIPLLSARLKVIDSSRTCKDKLLAVVSQSSEILSLVNRDDLAMHFGRNVGEGEDLAKANKEMEVLKGFVVDALTRRSNALLDLVKVDAENANIHKDALLSSLKELEHWVKFDKDADKYLKFAVFRWVEAGELAKALKAVNKAIKGNSGAPEKVVHELRLDLLDTLGWTEIAENQRQHMVRIFPASTPRY